MVQRRNIMAVEIPTRQELQDLQDGASDSIRDALLVLIVDRIKEQSGSLLSATDVGLLIPITFSNIAIDNAITVLEATGNYTTTKQFRGGERRLYIALL